MDTEKSKVYTVTEYNRTIYALHQLNLKETRPKKVHQMILQEQPGRFLDIGCGSGDFSALFINYGW